jgi:hypothetical protein
MCGDKLIVIIAAAMPTILLLRAIFSMCDGDRFAEPTCSAIAGMNPGSLETVLL